MTTLAALVVLRGRREARRLVQARQDPVAIQEQTLCGLLAKHAQTDFGRQHGFATIRSARGYAEAVPIRDYEGFRPYVERMLSGERDVLTSTAPIMFGTTSGTTASRKFVPITNEWTRCLSRAMRLWLARCTLAHPTLWDARIFSFVGASVEETVACGLPAGSVSGLTYAKVARSVRKRYALPPVVSDLCDTRTRYEVAAQLMMSVDVSLAAAPNPTTLLRLAEVVEERSDLILEGIATGRLMVRPNNDADALLIERLNRSYGASPERARILEATSRADGRLLPKHAWPSLAMIGCWLGGTAGIFATRLVDAYGGVPLRDLGLRATEATMTIALHDGTAAGVPLVFDNYYEFLPLDDSGAAQAQPVGLGDLEVGRRYFILTTTPAGLYRYDISDVVEVAGHYQALPLLRFVHKGPDIVNVTGEKVHARQVAEAVERGAAAAGVDVIRAQVIADVAAARYDLLVETSAEADLERLADLVDQNLCGANVEYRSKRQSERLGKVRCVAMRRGWSAALQAADVAKGSRDAQYKWPFIRQCWDDVSLKFRSARP